MNQDSKRKVTVEDLLRLKRAERPAPEFWATFESRIRSKQLAAIVVRRPWWDGASRIFALAQRHSVPIGAFAAVALAWAGMRQMDYSPLSTLAVAPRPAHAALVAPPAPASQAERHEAMALVRREPAALVAISKPAAEVVGGSSHLTPAPATLAEPAPARSPFADGIAVTLSDIRASAPMLVQRDVFGTDQEFEAPATPSRQQDTEPLARMDPSAERRARLLAPALPTYASTSARPLANPWMKQRADDDRMYESMDPYGSSDRAVVGFRF